ncbi:MAG: hypothetical protein ACTSRE_08850 [Promethearchaeota archaeon]
METEFYWKRRRRVRLVFASISLLCLISLVVLLILENQRLTFEDPTALEISIYVVSGIMASFLTIFSIMEVKEYISHFRGLRNDSYHSHRLTYKQVIDNDSRKQIIESILEEPGIHYNHLRKKCNLQPGQFRWHIDVLLNYKIIRRENYGQNVVFFPTIGEYNQDIDMILKFTLRDSIYQIIEKNPGIILSDIARELDIPNQRNKVKYHVDKLISANIITVVQKGRKRELFKIIK